MNLTVGRLVRVSPESAWALISDTSSWSRWGPSVSAVEPPETTLSLGMTGRVRTPVGLWLPYKVTAFDPPHSWAWSVFGVPATSHCIEPDPGGCRILFGVPAYAFAYLPVCRLALHRIAALLEDNDRA